MARRPAKLSGHLPVIVLRAKFRKSVLHRAHNSDTAPHVSARNMYRKLVKQVFWPTLRGDVRRWVGECGCRASVPAARRSLLPALGLSVAAPPQGGGGSVDSKRRPNPRYRDYV